MPAGRPAQTPRLDRIDAAALGEEAQIRVEEYLATLALKISPSSQIKIDHGWEPRLAVQSLTAYAQGRGGLDASPIEYCQTICEALWIRPIDGAGYETPELDRAIAGDLDSLDDDLRGRLCVVMIAALAREKMERGHALTVTDLAALASRSPDHIRLRGREGAIKLVERDGDLQCSAAQARKFLGAC